MLQLMKKKKLKNFFQNKLKLKLIHFGLILRVKKLFIREMCFEYLRGHWKI